MADIKTRDIGEKSIKTLDRSQVVGKREKDAYIRTKDKSKQSVDTAETPTEEYAADRYVDTVNATAHESVHQLDKQGRNGVKATKENISNVQEHLKEKVSADATTTEVANTSQSDFPKYDTTKSIKNDVKKSPAKASNNVQKTTKQSTKAVKNSVKNTSKVTAKTAKGTVKAAQKSIKTAEKTGKVAIKTAEKSAKATKTAAKASARAARATAQVARVAAKAAITATKIAVKVIVISVKAIIAAVKALAAAIAAGGLVAIVIIIVICLIALIVGSCYGIFFSNEDVGNTYSLQSVITEINNEYLERIEDIKNQYTYDEFEISGQPTPWEEVLSIYSVKTTTDPNNPTEIVTINDSKKALIGEIFWLINTITTQTEIQAETMVTQTTDEHGNVVETTTTVTTIYLYITVTHKSVDEMANYYEFNEDQRKQIAELMSDENSNMWNILLAF